MCNGRQTAITIHIVSKVVQRKVLQTRLFACQNSLFLKKNTFFKLRGLFYLQLK